MGDISADGQLVTFESYADNIDPNDTNNVTDVFLYDARTARTERISMSSEGIEGNAYSHDPVISADGTIIMFNSEASNLHSEASNLKDPNPGVFVFDQSVGKLDFLSEYEGGQRQPITLGSTGTYDITPDGDTIVVSKGSEILLYEQGLQQPTRLPLDAFGSRLGHAVVSDEAGVIAFCSGDGLIVWKTKSGAPPGRVLGIGGHPVGCSEMDIADNGSVIVFVSKQDDIVAADTNNVIDVFAYMVERNEIVRVSLRADGTQDDVEARWPKVSATGMFVTFTKSDSGNKVWRYDFSTGVLDLVGDGQRGRISEDGEHIAIERGGQVYLHYLPVSK